MDSLYILLAFVLGWLIAQSAKVVITLILRKGKLKFSEFLAIMAKSGGMPSGHTASFVAATLTIGFRLGFSSAIFALAACNTIIIIYDATNVRYAVGQQGKLLNKIVADTQLAKPLKLVEGHTVAQAIVGFIIGVLIAVAIQFVTFGKIF
ncbi:MAG: divergent PAP2 family protein [Candidatus Saccharibacteria bacterium]|nr:divergent PAP2 family protein [Candidatus Saccharibacteria bacterium]MDO4967803.1 divergent PAP2 family protein [Candidatus Saccharibacteria bacterium]